MGFPSITASSWCRRSKKTRYDWAVEVIWWFILCKFLSECMHVFVWLNPILWWISKCMFSSWEACCISLKLFSQSELLYW